MFVLLIAAGIGGVVGYLAMRLSLTPQVIAELKSQSSLSFTLFLFSIIPILWFVIFFHEAGHLLGGALGGFRPVMLFAGPLKLSFEHGKVRPSWNGSLSTWGGLALAIPKEGQGSRDGYIRVIVGGPLASILLAVIAGFAAIYTNGLVKQCMGLLCLTSGAIGFGTLLPLRSGGFVSDGGQLLALLRGSRDAEARLKLAVVFGESCSGKRPREWSASLISEAIEVTEDPVIKVSALSMLASAVDDGDDVERAREAFEAFAKQLHEGALSAYPVAFRGALILPIVVFNAERLNDAEAAQRWLNVVQPGVMEKYFIDYAKAAIAAARGDKLLATEHARKALSLIKSTDKDGSTIKYRERLTRLAELS